MRAYVAVTGLIFGLLVVAHIMRIFAEGRSVVDLFYVIITSAAAALCIWAVVLLRRSTTPDLR
ncbi:MAG: hypothetical protein JWM95_2219 [Gemmatimonadetes bacterium]|nr:hypothetical protein [Gemmatimonadota bacterium]